MKMNPQTLSEPAQRVQKALDQFGINLEVTELPETTRTALDAAQALKCEVAEIAKSLVFMGKNSNKPYLIVASGTNHVEETHVQILIGEPLILATPEFVLAHTGFAVGGVPPVGHVEDIPKFIDEDLMKFDRIWAAAGTPNAVFKLTPAQLERITEGRVISVVGPGAEAPTEEITEDDEE